MLNLRQRVEQTILTRKLLDHGQAVLAAVSGGLDSMVLLHVLQQLSKEHHWRLTVAHLNHGLRGRSSDADERLVRKRAGELNVPCITDRADVREFARIKKVSIEMAARQLRHEFLARVARDRGIQKIALAHHGDDQVELFFLRLLRGAGSEGLRGMKWVTRSPVDRQIEMIRPLLDCAKAELRQFAREERIAFREDASNTALDILRNRIRHELLPLLKKRYQPGIIRVTRRLMEILDADEEFITRRLEDWLREKKPAFENLAVALQRRVLQLQLHQEGWAADFYLIEQLRKAPDLPVTLTSGVNVQRDVHGFVHIAQSESIGFNSNRVLVPLHDKRGKQSFDGLDVRWEIRRARSPRLGVQPKPGRELFDADKVGGVMLLRHWQAGDRFQPIGMRASVKLQDLFTNQKIPRQKRTQLAVATTATGDLVWVEGLRISERFKLDKGTVRTLTWIWRRD